MPHDSADPPKEPTAEQRRRRSETDLPDELAAPDVDPATSTSEDEDETRLPELLGSGLFRWVGRIVRHGPKLGARKPPCQHAVTAR